MILYGRSNKVDPTGARQARIADNGYRSISPGCCDGKTIRNCRFCWLATLSNPAGRLPSPSFPLTTKLHKCRWWAAMRSPRTGKVRIGQSATRCGHCLGIHQREQQILAGMMFLPSLRTARLPSLPQACMGQRVEAALRGLVPIKEASQLHNYQHALCMVCLTMLVYMHHVSMLQHVSCASQATLETFDATFRVGDAKQEWVGKVVCI